MAVRRMRTVLAVVVLWIVVLWYYRWTRQEYGSALPLDADGALKFGETWGSKRWRKLPTRYPVENLAGLPKLTSAISIPKVQAAKPQEDVAARDQRLQRLAAVKDSFKHSWDGYKKYAWLKDEVAPISGSWRNPFGGWAATLVDSLDTLWIMNMTSDFDQAAKACHKIDFTRTEAAQINVFETTIRYLGGFLAAYELSEKQYPILLAKAVEVGQMLLCAFDTPNRMPISRWDWRSYVEGMPQTAPMSTLLSEIGSLSLEFSKLSQLTGDLSYHDAGQRISNELEEAQYKTYLPGMWPIILDASKSPVRFMGEGFTLGGMSDSLYEYFPKQYLLLGGMQDQPRKLYEGFIDVAKKHLFRRALNPGNLPILFSGDARINFPNSNPTVITNPRTQHLTCFAGGMVGLAAKIFDRPVDMDTAIQLTNGCVWSYNVTGSGIGPEIFHFVPCHPDPEKDDCKWSPQRWLDSLRDYWEPAGQEVRFSEEKLEDIVASHRLPLGMVDVDARKYILRPEAIESVFLMYRMTGDPTWMDKAWDMFTAIEKHTRTKRAAATLDDVTKEKPAKIDSMESFWLAETMKYFYLVFSEWDVIDLDKWVLNTEAHPLRRADAA